MLNYRPVLGNMMFLANVFGEAWPRALVAGFPGDPENPANVDWTAYPAKQVWEMGLCHKLNWYFCPSLVRGRRRVLSEFVSFHVIVVDDYGTKIAVGEPERVLGCRPNYVIESSLGNYQAGWFIEPQSDLAWVRGMLKKLREKLGAGDNLTDPMAWRRLPVGINGKEKYRSKAGKAWQVELVSQVYLVGPSRVS